MGSLQVIQAGFAKAYIMQIAHGLQRARGLQRAGASVFCNKVVNLSMIIGSSWIWRMGRISR